MHEHGVGIRNSVASQLHHSVTPEHWFVYHECRRGTHLCKIGHFRKQFVMSLLGHGLQEFPGVTIKGDLGVTKTNNRQSQATRMDLPEQDRALLFGD